MAVIPERRSWKLEFCCIEQPEYVQVFVDGSEAAVDAEYDEEQSVYVVKLKNIPSCSTIEICFRETVVIVDNDVKKQIFERLYRTELEYDKKEEIYQYVLAGKTVTELLGILQGMELPDAVYGMLCEVLLA